MSNLGTYRIDDLATRNIFEYESPITLYTSKSWGVLAIPGYWYNNDLTNVTAYNFNDDGREMYDELDLAGAKNVEYVASENRVYMDGERIVSEGDIVCVTEDGWAFIIERGSLDKFFIPISEAH